jgi:SAM-dependent methyltransferase
MTAPNPNASITCVACGQQCTGPVHAAVSCVDASVGHFRKCTGCGTLTVVELVDYGALYNDWASVNYASSQAGPLSRALKAAKQRMLAASLGRILGSAPRTVSLLDYGCGSGDLANAALAMGLCSVSACDVQALRPTTLEPSVAYAATTQLPPNWRFELIVARHVLEHIVDPRRALTDLGAHLTPGGRIYIEVPTTLSVLRRVLGRRWPGFYFPYHVAVFSERGMDQLVARCGREVAQAWGCNNPIVEPLLVSLGMKRNLSRVLSIAGYPLQWAVNRIGGGPESLARIARKPSNG